MGNFSGRLQWAAPPPNYQASSYTLAQGYIPLLKWFRRDRLRKTTVLATEKNIVIFLISYNTTA
jgi:hypothetical protein